MPDFDMKDPSFQGAYTALSAECLKQPKLVKPLRISEKLRM